MPQPREGSHGQQPQSGTDPAEELELASEPDFAEEHTDATVADQLPGGPEREPEPESPEGYAGMDRADRDREPAGGTEKRHGEDRT